MDRTIQLLTDMWNRLQNEHHNVVTEENYDALKKAIKALEQTKLKPSYNSVKTELDAISRADVLNLCESKDPNYAVIHFKEDVECLPSVSMENPNRCEDAISRQAVEEILTKYHLGESRIAEELNELPSVQRTSNANKKYVENTLEDAISRRKAIDIIYFECGEWRGLAKTIVKEIEKLPPVSTEKTVLYSGDGYADGHMVYDMAECPNCGYEYEYGDKDWGLPFCPNCGQSLNWESEE